MVDSAGAEGGVVGSIISPHRARTPAPWPRRPANRPQRGSAAGRGARGRGSCRAASGGDTRGGPSPPSGPAETAASFPQSTVLDLGQVDLELVRALRAAHDADRLPVGVDALVQAL